jgi:hypothetical protein
MTGIVNAATAHSKLEMKEVARVVREKWEELTEAIASAERDLWIEPDVLRSARRAARRSAVFAISSTPEKKNARVGIGKMQAAIDQVDGPERAILMLDLQRIVRKAYKTARKADVEFRGSAPIPMTPRRGANGWTKSTTILLPPVTGGARSARPMLPRDVV